MLFDWVFVAQRTDKELNVSK